MGKKDLFILNKDSVTATTMITTAAAFHSTKAAAAVKHTYNLIIK